MMGSCARCNGPFGDYPETVGHYSYCQGCFALVRCSRCDGPQFTSDHPEQCACVAKRPSTPPYYARGGIVGWDVIEAWDLNYNLGCVVKYVMRAGHKTPDPREDLRKAIRCLERELELIEDGRRALAEQPPAEKKQRGA